MQSRTAYIEKMKHELDELNVKLIELEFAAANIQDDTRRRYDEEIAKVRVHSDLAKEKLTKLKESSEDSWKTMVTDVEKIRDAFINSFHYFKSQL
jgi:predicted  nucleic acid-binding Zn-ribbon protein